MPCPPLDPPALGMHPRPLALSPSDAHVHLPHRAASHPPRPPAHRRYADPDPDFALLDAWVAGDLLAGSRLVDRHLVALLRFFFNKLDLAREDVVQRTLRACVERRHRTRRWWGFRTYLLAHARDVLYLELDRPAYGADPDTDPEEESLASLQGELKGQDASGAATEDRHAPLLGLLRELPVDEQIALELALWEDLSATQVAVVLGRSELGLHHVLHRARAAIRERLRASPDTAALLGRDERGIEGWIKRLRELAAAPLR